MDFFERLENKAFDAGNDRIDQDDNERFGLTVGIDATIEALKEMINAELVVIYEKPQQDSEEEENEHL